MSRHFPDWLSAYVQYASYGEAPKHMHFWVGVSTLAGALRRKVWIDQTYFQWRPNFYLVLVAPPGIVSKSTTASIGMRLLRRIPDIHFGPDVVTWPALITAFSESAETFPYAGSLHTMSALTISSSEFGNLLDPQDKQMVDLLVNLWDGETGVFEKRTKTSGNDNVVNPWINLIACTTPSWIAGNFPEYMVGGGFTSRCLFIYANEKAKYVAYPALAVPPTLPAFEAKLVEDLTHIATALAGPYGLTPRAISWGESWYERHYRVEKGNGLDMERFGGYVARKQTHIHKLAMVLAASRSDELVIDVGDLETAADMVTDLEKDMGQTFTRIGKSETSMHADRLMGYIRQRSAVPYPEAYRFVHAYFPSPKEFDEVLTGLVRAGLVRVEVRGTVATLIALR